MNKRNDDRKNEIYKFINEYLSENGVSPTTAEIAARFGISKSTVSKFVNRLNDEGLIERVGRYHMTTDRIEAVSYRMPIIGTVACGKPILAEEDIKGYIPIDPPHSSDEFFGLIAEGDSMIDAGISDGDIVYIKRQSTADEGDIVVAMIEDDSADTYRATLKRFFRDSKNKRYVLHPENKSMQDIIVGEVKILGVAYRVLKTLK